jgi:23S rRNA (cytidine1920-2'-O)/16S rRNA (cytidine1409-2'-O)-methyltransferase
MRLDVYLSDKGYADSRTEAKKLIIEGKVTVSGVPITKPSYDVTEGEPDIAVDRSDVRYASRGGLKLEYAMKQFGISAEGRLCVDIGASSGGFTDCLLKGGAAHVISIDAGSGQLVPFLRNDDRVTVIENYNARYMTSEDLEYTPNLAVMDVSFISATYIIGRVYDILDAEADFICLIKPQFEVGRGGLGKGGIVKDDKIRKEAVNKVLDFAKASGFEVVSTLKSAILGGDGNIEYIAHFRKR